MIYDSFVVTEPAESVRPVGSIVVSKTCVVDEYDVVTMIVVVEEEVVVVGREWEV